MKVFLKIIGAVLISLSAIVFVCRVITRRCPLVIDWNNKSNIE